MTYYAVQASVHHTDDYGWTHHAHLPTFYLHSNVQGILTESGAERVAENMIRSILVAVGRDGTIDVTAVAQDD